MASYKIVGECKACRNPSSSTHEISDECKSIVLCCSSCNVRMKLPMIYIRAYKGRYFQSLWYFNVSIEKRLP